LTADKGLSSLTSSSIQSGKLPATSTSLGEFSTNEVCAKVVGYRGVIKSFKKIDPISKSDATKAEASSSGRIILDSSSNYL
jgi:hypothetical protein